MKKMMVLMVMILGVFSLGGLTACQNTEPISVTPDPVAPQDYPRQILLHESLQDYMLAQPAIVIPSSAGAPMEVVSNMRSTYEKPIYVQYRYTFYDRQGRPMKDARAWKFETMRPQQMVSMTGNSLSDAATDWMLEIRPAE